VAEPVIEETIELPSVARQHGCVSLVLKRRYRFRNIPRARPYRYGPVSRLPERGLSHCGPCTVSRRMVRGAGLAPERAW